MATETHGYTATKDQLLKRLRRIEGQVGGLVRMVEQERYCVDILTQIRAARADFDKRRAGVEYRSRVPAGHARAGHESKMGCDA